MDSALYAAADSGQRVRANSRPQDLASSCCFVELPGPLTQRRLDKLVEGLVRI